MQKMLTCILEQKISLDKYTKYLGKSQYFWFKEYEAGEFWKEYRKGTADPQPLCTKIGLSLLDTAAEPTHFEPSWDPISQFATQGKGSIQHTFTRVKLNGWSPYYRFPLLPLELAAAVQFVPPHICAMRMHCSYRGNWFTRGGFTDPLWFVQSLQLAEFSAGRWAWHIISCFTSVKVEAPDKLLVHGSSRAQCGGTAEQRVSEMFLNIREKRVVHLSDALELAWSLKNCIFWSRNLNWFSKECIPFKLVET